MAVCFGETILLSAWSMRGTEKSVPRFSFGFPVGTDGISSQLFVADKVLKECERHGELSSGCALKAENGSILKSLKKRTNC
jgi:hypothetical protein